MDIKCTVRGQKLEMNSETRHFPQGSDEFVRFLFTLSEDWDGLMAFAQFRQNERVSNEYLTEVTVREEGQDITYMAATLPHWPEPGLLSMTLYGTGDEHVIGTTNYVVIGIDPTGFIGAEISDMDETLYQQMVNRFIQYEYRYDIVRDYQGAWEALLNAMAMDPPANTWSEVPVVNQAEAPSSPADGAFWRDSDDGKLYRYSAADEDWIEITGKQAAAGAPPQVFYYYNTTSNKLYQTPITAIPPATASTVGGIRIDTNDFRMGTGSDAGILFADQFLKKYSATYAAVVSEREINASDKYVMYLADVWDDDMRRAGYKPHKELEVYFCSPSYRTINDIVYEDAPDGFRKGYLIAVKDTASGTARQILFDVDNNKIWQRSKGASEESYSAWIRINTNKAEADELTSNTASLVAANAGTIPDDTDFDTLTTPGNYKVVSYASANTMDHIPKTGAYAYGGRLFVLALNVSNSFLQVYTDTANATYQRTSYYEDNVLKWRDWDRIETTTTVNAKLSSAVTLVSGNATSINSGADLDLIVDAGNYRIAAAAASSIANVPKKGVYPSGGRLLVFSTNAASNLLQIYIDTTNTSFFRTKGGSGWSEWERIETNATIAKEAITLDSASTDAITNGTDFNTLTTPGNYKVSSYASANTMVNIPKTGRFAYGGRLFVLGIGANILQLYADTTNAIYYRNKGANWADWEKVSTKVTLGSDAVTTSTVGAKTLENGSDFNDIVTPGNYIVSGYASANTMVNIPKKGEKFAYAGRLIVLSIGANTLQIYADSRNTVFFRNKGASWSDWERIVTSADDLYTGNIQIADVGMANSMRSIMEQLVYDIRFANSPAPIYLVNYVGNSQNVHPKVLYFPDKFGGHAYWMAYTPYPKSYNQYENPCIAYSDDGYAWKNILANPLDDPGGEGYDSDTHLVYNPDTELLECWFRFVEPEGASPRREIIYRCTSADGVNWSDKSQIYTSSTSALSKLLSPAIEYDDGLYKIWVIDAEDDYHVKYYEADSTEISSWRYVDSFAFDIADTGISVYPWHLDVIRDDGGYVMLIMCRANKTATNNICSLFIAESDDNETYTTPVKVISGNVGVWDKYMYRSTIVRVPDGYRIYYSAGSGSATSIYGNFWGIGIAESNTLSNFIQRYR